MLRMAASWAPSMASAIDPVAGSRKCMLLSHAAARSPCDPLLSRCMPCQKVPTNSRDEGHSLSMDHDFPSHIGQREYSLECLL